MAGPGLHGAGGPGLVQTGGMCRSIKTLREPYAESVTSADVHAAALQYVRKVSGFHQPAAHNVAAFDAAVAQVAATTQQLLDSITVRGGKPAARADAPAGRVAVSP